MANDVTLSCRECDFTTSKERRLVKHLRKSHGKAAIKCPWCIDVHYSDSVVSLCVHKKHDHRSVRLRCFLCEFTSRSLSKWASHVTLNHSGQTLSLVILTVFSTDLRSRNQGFFIKAATERNLGSDEGLQVHCDKEGQASSEASAQGTHLEPSSENVLLQIRGTISEQKISDSTTAGGESSRFSCNFCEYTTSKCKKLRKHVKQDHSDSTSKDFCVEGSDSGKHVEQDHSGSTATHSCVKVSDCRKHLKLEHFEFASKDFSVEGSDTTKSTEKSCFKCPYCENSFSTVRLKEKRLVKHLRKSHGKAAIKCPWCIDVHYSDSVASLCVHKKHDHRSVRLRCFLCAFTSRSLSKWASHVNLSHSGQTSSLVILTGFSTDPRSKNAGSRIQDLFFKTATDRNLGSDEGLQAHCDKEGQASSEASAQGTHLELSSENTAVSSLFEWGHLVCVQACWLTLLSLSKWASHVTLNHSGQASSLVILTGFTPDLRSKNAASRDQDLYFKTASERNVGSDESLQAHCDKEGQASSEASAQGTHLELSSENDVLVQSRGTISEQKISVTASGESSRFSCTFCEYTTSKCKKLRKHVEQDHSDSTSKDFCVKGSDSGKHVNLEYLDSTSKDFSVEGSDTIKSTEKSCFKCPYCRSSFSTGRLLGRHCKSQHLQGSFYHCPQCAFQGKAASSLLRHLRCHTGERPFACHLCSYKSALYGTLMRHLNQHKDIKPYKCSQCDYRATRKDILIHHTRTHTNERPYHCSMCEYSAKQAGALRIHIRTHTKEKPYKCEICLREFSRRYTLNMHLKNSCCI
ncbi:Zinc finger protein 2 [Plakobranchus ocellatus]|uniref:Zinc finger protein 2 n=1 Tax=Plakobranchus ocellatus TaxID=259542 RepID=A0AAV4C1V0_9GAST|nr:Zinc finger protein 2 [Plakobranchus ocellatus]